MQTQIVEHQFRNRIFRASVASESRGFSPERLSRFHEALRAHVTPGQIPGLVALVHHRGRTHVEALGQMAFGSTHPMQRDCIFRLASTTKPITAVASMILVEECKLRLDDPIAEWLPELKNPQVLRKMNGQLEDTVPLKRPIIVRDLLTFRSGYGEISMFAPQSPLALEMMRLQLPLMTFPFPGSSDEFLKRLANLPLACQPGERWLYHMGSEILGVLIERVTGKSFADFLQERIFAPLGMKDTSFHVPESKRHRIPTCYGTDYPNTNLIVLHEGHRGYISEPGCFESGAGGLASTVDDLMAFGQMMMNFGSYKGERILSRPTVELMITDQMEPEQKLNSPFFENFWLDHSWGLGLGLVTKRTDLSNSPGRFGWDGAFGTSFWVDPKEQLVGVLLAQRRPNELAFPKSIRDFWNSAYQLIDD